MANVIVGGIIVLILVGVITYIVKEKKKGTKCIGCSCGGGCSSKEKENDEKSKSCKCQ